MNPIRVVACAAVIAAALLTAPAPALGQAACGPVETTPDEGHLHLLGEAPPPGGYRSTPPASGWHYRERGRVRLGVAPGDAPLSEPEQVSVLAVGGVVIGYRDLDPAAVTVLEDVVAEAGERPVALTPNEALEPGEVALSAWRRVQRCDGADEEAVREFVGTFAAGEPDWAMSGEHDDHGDAAAAAAGDDPVAAGDATAPPWLLGAVGAALLAGFGLAARRALRAPPG